MSFQEVLISDRLKEAYTWYELRYHVHQCREAVPMFDDMDIKGIFAFIRPYLTVGDEHYNLLVLADIVCNIMENDTVIIAEDKYEQEMIMAIIKAVDPYTEKVVRI